MSFTADIQRFATMTNSDIGTAKRAIVFALFGQVVAKTPVDTGRAKGNWFVTENTPSPDTTERDDTSPPGAVNVASQTMLNLVTEKLTVDILTNNLPYIEALEFGSSTQAPSGMLRTTLRAFARIAKKEGWK